MILEVAILQVKPNETSQFEHNFRQAEPLIMDQKGYLGHELQRCLEQANKYILLVRWESVAAHEDGFRHSREYQEWRELLHHFYEPFPAVEHYELVTAVSP
jgi:heme-degrading monooxygenase HmoA